MGRLTKQLVIAGIYGVVFVMIVWGLYRLAVPAPTCTDGIKNGQEEGLDCGALACGKLCAPSVKPITILPVQVISYGNGSADAVLTLTNPNSSYGVSAVPYTLSVTDGAEKTIATRQGASYLAPLEKRVAVIPLTDITLGASVKAEVRIDPTAVRWVMVDPQDEGIAFAVQRDTLVPMSTSLHFEATTTNKSRFAVDTVDVSVLVYDHGGAVVGAGSTIIKTLAPGEERAFSIDWPFAVPDAVRTQVMVTTNVLNNDNYLRAHGGQEPFQAH